MVRNIQIVITFAVVLWMGVPVLYAVDIEGRIHDDNGKMIFTLTWSNPEMSATSETKEGELLLRFSQPIHMVNQQDIFKQGETWLQDMVVSFDTVFIKLRSQMTVKLENIGNQRIEMQFGGSEPRAIVRSSARIRLGIIKARLMFKQGRTEESLSLLDKLLANDPDESSILLTKADLLYQLGRLSEAMELVYEAEQKEPGSVAVRQAKNRYSLAKRPFIVAEVAHKDTCFELGERFYRIQYEARPSARLTLGIKHSTYGIEYNRNDQATPLIDENRQTELYGTLERDSGSLVSASLFIHVERDAGLALSHKSYESNSSMTIGIDLMRPNWEYFISQVETDHKHRLRVRYQEQINDRAWYMLFPALNQYILWDLDPTPTSLSFQGAISYRFLDSRFDRRWLGENSYLSAELDVDFETPLSVEEKDGVSKSRFTKWVHSPRLNIGKQYGCWDFYGYMGYAFRVYSGSGQLWGAHARCEPFDRFNYYFKADHAIDENGCLVTLLTLGMKWII